LKGQKNGYPSSKPETALVQKQQGYFNYLHGIMVSNINQAESISKKQLN
jgi:hypothetical protein